jgi:UDP-N-acetylmuramoylalanine--D-glutamate ligase
MKTKRMVILGGGESGVGAAVLACKKGYEVFLSDAGKLKQEYKSVLEKYSVQFEEGQHTEALILNADEIVKSPGILETALMIKKIRAASIPVVSEIEFASRHTTAKMIAITGSNGKTTTTLLTYHILKNAGVKVGLAGNIGKSLALQVAENGDHDHAYYVVELSSFQLDDMFEFKAHIAVLTNISANHLDRYEYDMQKYTDSKFRITQNQTAQDYFIYCADNEGLLENEIQKRTLQARLIPFSIKRELPYGAFVNTNNELTINITDKLFTMSIFDLALQGKHNLYNSMAAGVAARILDIRKDSIRESLADFENIEHRLEFVASVHGIEFINDSKSTTVNSTWYALESMNKRVVLVMGGVDKGNDYGMLRELIKDKVSTIICLGKDNKKIHGAFEDIVPQITDVLTADEAVKIAYKMGKKGEVVLLSPACASFDLFENYEDRGRQFKQAVRSL